MMLRTRTVSQTLLLAFTVCISGFAFAQNNDARAVAVDAATALGGVERVQSLHTLRLRGYGNEAYQDGGSEITTEDAAPEKVTNLTAYERAIDLDNGRTLVRARMYRAFIFAGEAMMRGQPLAQALDGMVAFDLLANGAARRQPAVTAAKRRMDLLANPVMAVRAALAPESTLANRRVEGDLVLIDVTTAQGEEFTLAADSTTHLPRWVRWIGPHENLGELTYRAEFSAYEPVNGIMLPMSYNVVSDFRDIVMLRLHVDRYEVDADIGNLAAPDAVRAASDAPPVYTVEAVDVAEGVTLLTGGGANSVLLEFADHLTLFEVPTNRAWSEAVIAKARALVPSKPLTQAIISHHHFDHTGGLRPAIAEGLTIIAQSGTLDWFAALAARPVTHFPDALSRNPQPLKTLGVDDHLRLEDAALTVDLYHVVTNNHMGEALLAYLPEQKLLIQGDLFDVGWEVYFWGDTYEANLAYRNLDVERDVPIHGRVLPLSEVREQLKKQTANAAALCAEVAATNLSMPGCPLAWEATE